MVKGRKEGNDDVGWAEEDEQDQEQEQEQEQEEQEQEQERTLKLSMQNLLYFSTSEMDPDVNFDSTNQHTTIFIHNPYDLVDLE